MNKMFALIRSLTSLIIHACRLCMRVEFLTQELTHMRDCYCQAKVRSSSMSVVFVCMFAHSIFECSPSKRGVP